MPKRYIDFISAYCDSWCERCAFTQRCSHFAVTSALAMCDGDAEAAFELALGAPRVPGRESQKHLQERMAEAVGDVDVSEKELQEIGRELDEREQRVRRHAAAEASLDYGVAAHRWLERHDRCAGNPDPAVHEAIDVIGWDSYLIHVKIMRALNGRDEYPNGAPFEKNATQSDWNGSAKVALLSVERSERAWRVVAAATGDEAAGVLADSLKRLAQETMKQFPRAMEFRRPGFDD
ncbi:MAG TPA: hypothetical protein VEL51_18370 [Vicinamibacterales bacterium]|nr:hypothetical protein [Vicinamibacterales bacterium]